MIRLALFLLGLQAGFALPPGDVASPVGDMLREQDNLLGAVEIFLARVQTG